MAVGSPGCEEPNDDDVPGEVREVKCAPVEERKRRERKRFRLGHRGQ